MNVKFLPASPDIAYRIRDLKSRLFQYYNDLEAERLRYGFSLKKKTFFFNGVYIIVIASEGGGKILAIGGVEVLPYILLTGGANSYSLSIDKDRLSKARISLPSGDIISGYNGTCQVGDTAYAQFLKAWKYGELNGSGSFLGSLPDYEAMFFNSVGNVTVRIGLESSSVLQMQDPLLSSLSGPYGSRFNLFAYTSGARWNQFGSGELHALSLDTGFASKTWKWTPAMFTKEPGNLNKYLTGWYYGADPISVYGEAIESPAFKYLPLESINVSLVSVLDVRIESRLINHGYCEHVTSVGYGEVEEDKNDLFFYFDILSPEDIATGTFANATGTVGREYITVGTTMVGKEASFKLLDFKFDISKVEMWTLESYNPIFSSATLPDSAVCIVISSGSNCVIYRYEEGASLILDTTDYHSHSISNDGSYLAVFFGSSSIESVTVYNLSAYEVDGVKTKGYSVIYESDIVDRANATSGALMQYREENFTPLPAILNGTDDNTDNNLTGPSYSIMSFPNNGLGTVLISKLVCANGTDVNLASSKDECFNKSVIKIANPREPFEGDDEQVAGRYDFNVGVKGLIRGDFTGEDDGIAFQGISPSTRTITMPEMVMVKADPPGPPFVFFNVAGEVEGLDEEGVPTDQSIDCGDEVTIYRVTSTCGQEAEARVAIPSLVLIGPEEVAVDDEYVAGGGVKPYTYSFDRGTIDPINGKIYSITDCGGPDDPPQKGNVTVTDDCGTDVTLEVDIPTGSWTLDSDTGFWDVCNKDYEFQASVETVSEKTRYVRYWCKAQTGTGLILTCGARPECCTFCTSPEEPSDPTIWARVHLNREIVYKWTC
jgi:hypothetical protein